MAETASEVRKRTETGRKRASKRADKKESETANVHMSSLCVRAGLGGGRGSVDTALRRAHLPNCSAAQACGRACLCGACVAGCASRRLDA
eukprot:285940-Pleurochrysis_carterae.AAC.5